MLRSAFVTLLLLSLGVLVHSDLPVHCLKSQVVGNWTIELTNPSIPTPDDYSTCGHKQPDSAATSNEDGLDGFDANITLTIILNSDGTAVKYDGDTKTNGNWTMIYDEGLDILFPEERFTNFFYYYQSSFDSYSSDCGKTTVGWYAITDGERACWKGTKVLDDDENADDLVGEQTEQRYIVQPKEYQSNKSSASMLELQSSSSKSKKRALRSESEADEEKEHKETNKRTIKYNKDFKNHKEIVDKINSNGKKTWRAKAYSKYESKTIGELNKMAGRKRSVKKSRSSQSFIQKTSQADVSDLPKEWSWEDSLGDMKEQGDCGSCYLVATLEMLEARLRIFYNEDVTLSIQYPLDCSYQNQGCDGGYPYLAGLFGNQYGLVKEECAPYRGKVTTCGNMCDVSQLDKIYTANNMRFVGGYYGNCDERSMMLELMNKGPMIANFEPTNDFMYYEGGVFQSEPAEWIIEGEEKPEWEKVDHSVLLFGWGETEDGLKYWALRNSWGQDWGENGSFRIVRGVDDSAIESYSEASDPGIVYL